MNRPKNYVDRTGKTYGKLTVIKSAGFSQKHQRTMWECRCDCGNTKVIQGKLLQNGTTKSCGCLAKVPRKRVDLTGKRFGLYTVIKFADNGTPEKRVSRFLCRCDCGTEKILQGGQIQKVYSCGCATNQIISEKNSTHGEASVSKRTKEYRTWKSIKDRCYLQSCKSYRIYGARGIKMSESWIASYEVFLNDVGRAPFPYSSIERINNDGDYEPGNCEWSTPKLQARNRSTNVFLTHNGKTQCALDWSIETGIPHWSIGRRAKEGWSIQKMIDHYGRNYQKQKYTCQT